MSRLCKTALVVVISFLFSCSESEINETNNIELRKSFKELSSQYYNRLENISLSSSQQLVDYTASHFQIKKTDLKVRESQIIHLSKSSNTNSYTEIFSQIEDLKVRHYLIEAFTNENDSLNLVDLQERVILDEEISNEAAQIILLTTETFLFTLSNDTFNTQIKKDIDSDNILRYGDQDCGNLNECNADCRKTFNDDMDYAAGSFAIGLVGIGIG